MTKPYRRTAEEQDRLNRITLSFGMATGALLAPDIIAYFLARGVTQKEIDECYKALVKVSKGFYRDPA